MRRTKQLLPGPGAKPLVAASFDVLAQVCGAMVVVLGHEAEAVSDALGERPRREIVVDPDEDMFESVRRGVAAAATVVHARALWILPADHPAITASTIALMRAAFEAEERIVIPEFGGRGGHPVLLPRRFAPDIAEHDGRPDGLRGILRARSDQSVRVPVDDPGVVEDVDDPEAYERAKRRWGAGEDSIPE